MKIKTNLRAGSGNQKQKRSSSTDSVDTAPVYVPPVSRCVGI